MYVPEKLKLNKFRDVRIPSPAEYFGRFGESLNVAPERFSGDNPISLDNRKISQLEDMMAYDKYMSEQEKNKDNGRI